MIDLDEFEYQDAYRYAGEHCRTRTVNLHEDVEYICFDHKTECVKYKTIELKQEILIPISKVMRMKVK
jgi:hypothetical protein